MTVLHYCYQTSDYVETIHQKGYNEEHYKCRDKCSYAHKDLKYARVIGFECI